MPGKFVVSLTCAKNDADKATVAFVVANAAVASDKKTLVFLSIEGTRLSQRGYADVDTSLAFRKPELRLRPDRERLSDLGVSLQSMVDGLNALGVGPRDIISILQAIKAAATEGNVVAVDAIREAFGVSGPGQSAAEEDIFGDLPELEDQERKS